MKNRFEQILFMSLLNCFFVFSQEKTKKEYLIDENKKITDLKTFQDKLKNTNYYYKIVEKDTATIIKLVLREEYGKYNEEIKKAIFTEIERISGKAINTDDIVIINFFNKPEKIPNGSCIDHYTSDSQFKNYTSKKKNKIAQFFIVEQNYSYKKNDVFVDNNKIIEKLSFENGLDCGNYIIIKPSGTYYRKLGEYRQDKIKEIINSKW